MIASLRHKLVQLFGQYIKQFSYILLYRILAIGANLVSGILIARAIGESNRGIYGLFLTSLLVFNTILHLGFNTSIIYFAKKATHQLKSIISFYFLLTLSCLVVIFLTLLFYGHLFKINDHTLILFFLITYFFLSLGNITRGILVGKEETVWLYQLDAFLKTLSLALVLICSYLKLLYLSAAISIILLEYFLIYYFTYQKTALQIFPIKIDLPFLKNSIQLNLKNFIVTILVILILRCDQYFVKAILGNYYVGLYSVNASIIENLGILGTLFSIQMLPKLIEMEDFLHKLEKCKKHLFLLFTSSSLIAIVFYFLAPILIKLYFKKEIPIAVESFQVLLLGFILWTMINYLHVLYLSLRVKKTYLTFLWLALFLNIALNKWMIPKWGIVGSSWASVISYSVLLLLCVFDLFVLKKNNYTKTK